MTVRDYLVAQGINMNNVTSQGFGENDPVATNATAAGRQQNRRVQMVVSGEPIGDVASAQTLPSNGPAASTYQQYQNPQGQPQPAATHPYQPMSQPQTTPQPQSTVPH